MAIKNQLTDLNNHLFEQLERLNDLTDEELETEKLSQEIDRAKAMTSIAQTIINTGALALSAQKHFEEYGRVPEVLKITKGGEDDV